MRSDLEPTGAVYARHSHCDVEQLNIAASGGPRKRQHRCSGRETEAMKITISLLLLFMTLLLVRLRQQRDARSCRPKSSLHPNAVFLSVNRGNYPASTKQPPRHLPP